MVVKAEVCYYAHCKYTGEVFEASDFKYVYAAVKRTLKDEMHQATYYDTECVIIHYGLSIREDDGSFRYVSLREVANVYCSGCDGVVHYLVEHA